MKRFFGKRSDGGPIINDLWWCWDAAEDRGYWVRADESYADRSDFRLAYWFDMARMDIYAELFTLPKSMDQDLRVDEGL